MYKKLLFLGFAILLAIATSGCIKNSTNIEITKKDEVIITQINGINTTVFSLSPDFSADNPLKNFKINEKKQKKLEEKGYEISDYKGDDYVGKKISKKFKKAIYVSPDSLPIGYSVTGEAAHPIDLVKSPFGTKCSFNLKFNPKKIEENNEDILKSNKKEQVSSLDTVPAEEVIPPEIMPVMDLTIKIPHKAYEHNATSVNEKTHEYTWVFSDMEDVKNGKSVDIILKYKNTNFISIIFIILIIIATFQVVSKNSQYSEKQTDENMEAF